MDFRHPYFRLNSKAEEYVFPLTGLTTVAASPCLNLTKPGEAPFRQLAPHNLPCREGFAERFQRGRLRTSEDVLLKNLNCAYRHPPRARRTWTHGLTSQGDSRNCLNITT